MSASTDPELFNILEKEKRRQRNSLVLIASENYAPRRVLDTLGTVMVS
jgi:glycine hydroxymethyltransferase